MGTRRYTIYTFFLHFRADMILSFFGMTHERHQFINFAYATEYATTFIISKASIGVSGEILEGVFDRHSYALSLVTLVVLTFIIIASNLLVQDPENSKSSGNYLNNICLRCIGHITAQGFPNSFRVPRYSGQLAWITLILFCLTFELMHSSIFISKLTATVKYIYLVSITFSPLSATSKVEICVTLKKK